MPNRVATPSTQAGEPSGRPDRSESREPVSHALSTGKDREFEAAGTSYSRAPYLSRTGVPGQTFSTPATRRAGTTILFCRAPAPEGPWQVCVKKLDGDDEEFVPITSEGSSRWCVA